MKLIINYPFKKLLIRWIIGWRLDGKWMGSRMMIGWIIGSVWSVQNYHPRTDRSKLDVENFHPIQSNYNWISNHRRSVPIRSVVLIGSVGFLYTNTQTNCPPSPEQWPLWPISLKKYYPSCSGCFCKSRENVAKRSNMYF